MNDIKFEEILNDMKATTDNKLLIILSCLHELLKINKKLIVTIIMFGIIDIIMGFI